jgi:hypothetical protein
MGESKKERKRIRKEKSMGEGKRERETDRRTGRHTEREINKKNERGLRCSKLCVHIYMCMSKYERAYLCA